MPSFDVVSRLDHQEIDNAIGNATREITTRYDFKGSKSSINRNDLEVIVISEDDMKIKQINDLLITHFVRRKIDSSALKIKLKEKASGGLIRQVYSLIQGIDQSIAKKITISIKNSKMKIQAKIQGDEIRIQGKKRDDLQNAMDIVRELKLNQPIQFINLRD